MYIPVHTYSHTAVPTACTTHTYMYMYRYIHMWPHMYVCAYVCVRVVPVQYTVRMVNRTCVLHVCAHTYLYVVYGTCILQTTGVHVHMYVYLMLPYI